MASKFGMIKKVKDDSDQRSTVLETDAYDAMMYTSMRDSSSKLSNIAAGETNTDCLVSDVFHSFYKSNPTVKEDAAGLSRKLIDTLHKLPEYQALRASTKLDDVCSALGTLKLAPAMVEQYKMQMMDADQKKQNAHHLTGKLTQAGPADPKNHQGDLPDEVRSAIRRSVKEAQDKVEQWEGVCAGWGIKPGDLKDLDYKEKFELANKLIAHDQFKKIAELAGRFRNMALAAAATTPSHGTDEIVDIIQGDNISRALPTELLKLKRTPALFYKDMLEGKLLQYNLKGQEELGAGPIIVCLDISGSMQGQREIWAKSVILALMFLAERQKRPFGVLTFDTDVRYSAYFPKDAPPTLQQKIKIASVASNGGGTDFYEPLKAAFEMRSRDVTLRPADVVFITDGECRMSKPQLREIEALKKETSVRIMGIGIDDSSYNGGCAGETLAAFSDNLTVINSLGEIEHVKGIFSKVASKTQTGGVK
jgi:uncharacterized protein with von Willebrand factor type A (vWA) domain